MFSGGKLYYFIALGIIFSSLFSPAVLAQKNLRDGLVLYLDFDEITGGNTFKDLSGKGNNGIIEGNLKSVNGKFGKAIENNGGVNFVRVKHNPILDPVDGKVSVSAWIYLSDQKDHSKIDWEHIILQWNDGPNEWTHHFALNYGKVSFIIADTNNSYKNAVGRTLIPVKEQHHVAGVADGKIIRVYLDGNEDGNIPYEKCNVMATDIGIACKTRGVFCGFNGIIDEVAIWNRSLSDQEIKQAMQGFMTPVDTFRKLTTTWGDIKLK